MKTVSTITTLLLALTVAACTANPTDPVTAGETIVTCHKEDLQLVNPGMLIVGTDSPAFPPWFNDDLASGQGFESALAYAVAQELGFTPDQVTWIVVPFNTSYQPGEKDFDFDINQISITTERDRAVDFSDGYYTVNQALVGYQNSQLAQASTITEVRLFRLGAQVGTTSLRYLHNTILPGPAPYIYDTTNDAKQALQAGEIDGIVVDLPTAFYISTAEIEAAAVIGQFPPPEDNSEQFGLLFEEDNPLRHCANQALARLRQNGRLGQLEQQWLADATNAPLIAIEP